MRRHSLFAFVAPLGAATSAQALEPGALNGEPVLLDVTETSSVSYNADNRDDRPSQVATRANDDWGAWYNRLNAQTSWGAWNAGLRLDNVWFYTSPDPTAIALELVNERPSDPTAPPPPVYFRNKVNEAGAELSNRYINWIYPAKYYIGYSSRTVEATLGDFYAQLGRGLVLNVRKQDELSSDTTVRGARVTARIDADEWRIRLTGLGGSMNPLRLDDPSGRYLGVHSSITPDFIAVTEAGMPRAVPTDFVRDTGDCATFATCSYAPDRLAGAQVELGTSAIKLGTQGTLLARQYSLSADVLRSARRILTASQSVDLPNLWGHGSAYLEGAVQDLKHTRMPETDLSGHAVYGSLTLARAPLTLVLEGKHYRRFFPLAANVSLTRAREFSFVQYSAPPTTEAFWNDTEFGGFNTCVTGGRSKLDVELGHGVSAFGWVGHYDTWDESVVNDACVVRDENLDRVWDVASGFELVSRDRKSRSTVTFGARADDTARTISERFGPTHVFYRENYGRYDVTVGLGGPYALQLQGWHRRRRQTFGGPNEPWYEGQHLTGLEWSPHVSVAFGVEYDTNPQTPDLYLNGQAVYKLTTDSSVSLFVGQRRGALRCVAGTCRVFPPFEGARLDVTLRM